MQAHTRTATSHISSSPKTAFYKRDRDFLDLLQRTVRQNYSNPHFGLQEMSALMQVGRRQLQRKLKRLLGCTPSEYLRTYRLNRSLSFLGEGAAIGDAARAAGFSSQSYFASCFKAHFAQTPTEYQYQLSRKAGVS
jgi:AraC-like DNA-binding protein